MCSALKNGQKRITSNRQQFSSADSAHGASFLLLCIVYRRSGLLEQGVDRIVAQVVDPKVQHTFRPQVERVVRQFLSPGNHVEEEEPAQAFMHVGENQDAQLPSPGNRAHAVLKTIHSFQVQIHCPSFVRSCSPFIYFPVLACSFSLQSLSLHFSPFLFSPSCAVLPFLVIFFSHLPVSLTLSFSFLTFFTY